MDQCESIGVVVCVDDLLWPPTHEIQSNILHSISSALYRPGIPSKNIAQIDRNYIFSLAELSDTRRRIVIASMVLARTKGWTKRPLFVQPLGIHLPVRGPVLR